MRSGGVLLPLRVPVLVRPGVIVLLVLLTAAVNALLGVTGAGSRPVDALLGALLVLGALVLHEAGHAIVGRLTGRRIHRLEFGLAAAVISSGDSTALRRAAAIAAGPLAEAGAGALLYAGTAGDVSSPLGAAGVIAMLGGAANLLPVHRSLDGYKLLRFLALAARGRAGLLCVPTGPCPACTGAASELTAADIALLEEASSVPA